MDNLTKKLKESNMFLSMAVHDMRNPTVSMKLGLQATLGITKSMERVIQEQLQFLN